jgi:hypothetical protein
MRTPENLKLLDFLTKGQKYKATIYEDAKDADWQKSLIKSKR